MFSVYKGLLLFILIANAIAIPIFKRESTDGKNYVFETVKTLLNCVCYYEEGETLDNGNIEKYCDCTPEKVEQDQSIVPEDEIENKVNAAKYSKSINENESHEIESKFSSAKYMKSVNGDDENLGDVQKYGSADAAFFADVDENEAKQEQENIYDEIQSQIENQIKKVENAKYMVGQDFDGDEENLGDVQKYGSADAAFFANLEENEAKQEQENINDEMAIPLFNGDGEFIPKVDDGEDVDVAAMEGDFIEDIPEYNSIDGTSTNTIDTNVNAVNNEDTSNDYKYAFDTSLDIGISASDATNNDEVVNDESVFYDNNNGDYSLEFTETRAVYDKLEKEQKLNAAKNAAKNANGVIYDESGNEIDLEIEMVGEAYNEVANDDDDDDDDGILDSLNVGANTKYVIDYYNNENDIDDEEVYEDMELDLEEEEEDLDINNNVQQKAMKNINVSNDDDDDDDAGINDDDDLKTIYKKLILNKLKEDIKNMDSEKLIVDILKEAFKSGKDTTMQNIIN
jgi:hypothetical protein